MNAPVREVVKLDVAPGTRSIEVVTCEAEGTCNLQVMFSSGFRISMPVLNGDTKDDLSRRIVDTVARYRPTLVEDFRRVAQILARALADSMADSSGKVELISARVAQLIPRWQIHLLWDYLIDLDIPVEYEDAMEILDEMMPAPDAERASPYRD